MRNQLSAKNVGCLLTAFLLAGDFDRREGRFTIEQCLKRQKYVLHGFEARALKHIPRIIFRVCERLLQLANCSSHISSNPDTQDANFTRRYLAYRLDNKGSKILSFASNNSNQSTPSDSIMATRRLDRLI